MGCSTLSEGTVGPDYRSVSPLRALTACSPCSFPNTASDRTVLQMPGHQGKLQFASGSDSDSVFGTHDPLRTANRLQEREEKRQACA